MVSSKPTPPRWVTHKWRITLIVEILLKEWRSEAHIRLLRPGNSAPGRQAFRILGWEGQQGLIWGGFRKPE